MANYTVSDSKGMVYILEADYCVEDPKNLVFVFYNSTDLPNVPAAVLNSACGYTISPNPSGTTVLRKSDGKGINWIVCDTGKRLEKVTADAVDAVTTPGTTVFYLDGTAVLTIPQPPSVAVIRQDCLICRRA
jgi:hypothetical protein